VRTQEYPIAGVVAECHSAFVDHVDRLSHASLALSSNAGAANPVLLRVNAVAAGAIEVVPSSGGGGAWVAAGDDLGLVFGDLIIGSLRRGDDGETATLGGMVLVLPAAIEHLLG